MTADARGCGRNDDGGSTLPLIAFFCALGLALVLTVVAVTSLYIERKRLLALADGAALVGAESFSIDDVMRAAGSSHRATLTTKEVASAVGAFVGDSPSDEFTRLHVDRAVSTDGRSATVELSAYWSPPVLSLIVPHGFRIQVTSIARSVLS